MNPATSEPGPLWRLCISQTAIVRWREGVVYACLQPGALWDIHVVLKTGYMRRPTGLILTLPSFNHRLDARMNWLCEVPSASSCHFCGGPKTMPCANGDRANGPLMVHAWAWSLQDVLSLYACNNNHTCTLSKPIIPSSFTNTDCLLLYRSAHPGYTNTAIASSATRRQLRLGAPLRIAARTASK